MRVRVGPVALWLVIGVVVPAACGSAGGSVRDGSTDVGGAVADASDAHEPGDTGSPDIGEAGHVDGGASEVAADTGSSVACFPSCVMALRDQCPFTSGEICQTESRDGGVTANCYSGGIRERSYPETLDGAMYTTTLRTKSDGQTACFYQSQLIAGTGPSLLIRDGAQVRVAVIEPVSGTRFVATCSVDSRTYEYDFGGPACAALMALRPGCVAGACGF